MKTNILSKFPDQLLEDILSGKCIPIIGAGFSINAKISSGKLPLWKELGKYFASKLGYEGDFENPLDSISDFCYHNKKPALIEKLRDLLHIDDVRIGKAHLSFARLYFKKILTTNYDFLIEKAFDEIKKPYHVIVSENQLSINYTDESTQIIKIHGDFNHPENMVLVEKDYDFFTEKNPLLTTYITSQLINKTPIFLGYSLNDPDLRQLLRLIHLRLGDLRRPAYSIGINLSIQEINRFKRRGIDVINLIFDKETNPDDYLGDLFEELRKLWQSKLSTQVMASSEEDRLFLDLPEDLNSPMIFFDIPFKHYAFYREHIFMSIQKFGYIPIVENDIIPLGKDFNFSQLFALIEKADIIISDNSSSRLKDYILKFSRNKDIIFVTESESNFVLYTNKVKILQRPENLDVYTPESDIFVQNLYDEIQKIYSKQYFPYDFKNYFSAGYYDAAIVFAFRALEYKLRDYNKQIRFPTWPKIMDVLSNLIPNFDENKWREYRIIRNRIVHEKTQVQLRDAKRIIKEIEEVLNLLDEIEVIKEISVEKRLDLNKLEEQIEIEKFFERNKTPENIKQLFLSLSPKIKNINKKIWIKIAKTAITFYDDRVFAYFAPQKKSLLISLPLHHNDSDLLQMRSNGKTWPAIKLKDNGDIERIIPLIEKAHANRINWKPYYSD